MRLAELQAKTEQLNQVLLRFGASNLAVFGSVARDQAVLGSDVDLLVDLPDGCSLLTRSQLKFELEDVLESPVDLIRRRSLKPPLRDRIETEAIQLA